MEKKKKHLLVAIVFILIISTIILLIVFNQSSVRITHNIFGSGLTVYEYSSDNIIRYEYGDAVDYEFIQFGPEIILDSDVGLHFSYSITVRGFTKEYLGMNKFQIEMDETELLRKSDDKVKREILVNGIHSEVGVFNFTKDEFFKLSKAKKLVLMVVGSKGRIDFDDVELPGQIEELLSAADIKE